MLRQLDGQARDRAPSQLGAPDHPAYEPGEDWYFCYLDDYAFELAGEGPSPSHT